MSPEKLPPTDEQRREGVRQEGRRGIIDMPFAQRREIGERLNYIWNLTNFQLFKTWFDEHEEIVHYYGYCPLFEPLKMSEEFPTYTMRVTFEDPEATVEMFKRRKS
uniref:Uncharacterized protein n=1 Tax=viral metagenome TaxID=1070528 RepID=A0A6H1ZH81_9ZZZZ